MTQANTSSMPRTSSGSPQQNPAEFTSPVGWGSAPPDPLLGLLQRLDRDGAAYLEWQHLQECRAKGELATIAKSDRLTWAAVALLVRLRIDVLRLSAWEARRREGQVGPRRRGAPGPWEDRERYREFRTELQAWRRAAFPACFFRKPLLSQASSIDRRAHDRRNDGEAVGLARRVWQGRIRSGREVLADEYLEPAKRILTGQTPYPDPEPQGSWEDDHAPKIDPAFRARAARFNASQNTPHNENPTPVRSRRETHLLRPQRLDT